MELLLNVIGHPGAGKSHACRHLKEQWDFEVYSPSNLIRDFARRRDSIPKGREAFSEWHKRMVDEDHLAFLRPILGSEPLRLCADGLRSPLDAHRVQQLGGYVLALTASPRIRHERTLLDSTRSKRRAPVNFNNFCKAELADAHTDPRLTNTQAVIDMADFTIVTDQLSATQVKMEIDVVVNELISHPKTRKPPHAL